MNNEPQQEKPSDADVIIAWVFAGMAIAGLLIWSFFPQVFTGDFWQTKSWVKGKTTFTSDASSNLRNFGWIMAAIVTLGFAFWRGIIADKQAKTATNQLDLAERGHATDRFQKGVEMLAKKREFDRKAGILILSDVARDDPNIYAWPVFEMICSFVVKQTHADHSTGISEPRLPPSDIAQALVSIPIVRSHVTRSDRKPTIFWSQLSGLDLSGYRIGSLDLSYANLSNVDFANAFIPQVNFDVSQLRDCDFSNARMAFSKFRNAHLVQCNFTNAWLLNADFNNAEFDDSNLSKAVMKHVRNLTQDQLDTAWAWSGEEPVGPSELEPSLSLSTYFPVELKSNYGMGGHYFRPEIGEA